MGDISTSSITAALLERLAETGVLIGDGMQPKGSGWQGAPGSSAFVPYIVLHTNIPSRVEGTLADANEDIEFEFQPTCVGATREQAGWVADQAREAILGESIVIPNRYAMLVTVDQLMGPRRDDATEFSVFISTDRFCIYVTPSSS